jgi:HEAT repeat protein
MGTNGLCGIFGLLLVVSSAQGGMVVWRSFAELEQSADLIVVGSASGGGQPGSVLSFTLQVSRVLKGGPSVVGTPITVDWTFPMEAQGSPAAAGSPATGNGLWFLQRSSSGWELLPVMQGDLFFNQVFIAEPSGPILSAYEYDPAAPLSDKVASELSAAIESADGGAPQLASLHFGLLDRLNSPVIQRLYNRMSLSTSPNQKILGLSGLIRGGSPEALSAALQAASSFGAYPFETGVLSESIRNEFRATDAKSVEILGQITTAPTELSLPLRQAAARALGAIHTKQALPYLAALLDDPDPDLRAEGVGGLGSFANGLPVQTSASVPSLAYLQRPTSAAYMSKETDANFALGPGAAKEPRLSFWKTWWLQNRAALGY